jgi:guanylate kinase
METKNCSGKVVIVSGPSGVGKSTICKEVVKRLNDAYLSVSVTTRDKTESEVDGEDYWFISEEQFQQRISKGLLLEYAEVFGNVKGAKQAKVIYQDAIMIFILPPSQKELAERMSLRNREDTETAEERLNGASDEVAAAWQYYKHMVINDDLEQAVSEVIEIIE